LKPEIESIDLKDIADLYAIEKSVSQSPWTLEMFIASFHAGHGMFVAKSEDKIVGFLIIMDVMEQLEILNIATHPDFHKQGIASQLLSFLKNYAKQREINSMFLEVRKSNQAAIALYQKFEFEQIGIRKKYYKTDSGQEDALMMQFSF